MLHRPNNAQIKLLTSRLVLELLDNMSARSEIESLLLTIQVRNFFFSLPISIPLEMIARGAMFLAVADLET